MDEHDSILCASVFNEAMTRSKMLLQVCGRNIVFVDLLVDELLRELGVETGADGEDVSDAILLQDELVLGSHVVTEENAVNNLV